MNGDEGSGSGVGPAGPDRGDPGHPAGGALRRQRKRHRLLKGLGLAAGLAVLGAVVAFAVAYALTPIPSTAQAGAQASGSVFYYNDGKSVIARQGVNRTPVTLDAIPEHTRAAVISAENRSFYDDPGVSLRGTVRAVWATITGKQIQGGSTITQQMVRNYYSGLSQQRTVTRKLKEIMIALKVGREKSKDWILQQYLNTIYFGRGAYGVQAAAQAYYQKDVGELTVSESAFLAAAIQTPSYFDRPYGDRRPHAESRWRYVLEGMRQEGTAGAADLAAARYPSPPAPRPAQTLKGQRGYLLERAKAELKRLGYSEDQINRGGLKVTTTFDRDLMSAAIAAVREGRPIGTPTKVRTGLTAIDPATGEVLAAYGGSDYLKNQYDAAFDAKPQAGSGFKPYVLAAALGEGIGLNTTLNGSSPQYFRGTPVRNDSNVSYGGVNLITATQRSINTAYVQLGLRAGLENVVDTAEKAGIPAGQLKAHAEAPTLSLGVASVSTAQQASGFATFAAGGTHRTAHVVRQVIDQDGAVRKTNVETRRAFDEDVARNATYAMTKVVESGTATSAQLPGGRPAAGKTGTTDQARAVWFNGFTPQLAASVAMFRDDNKPITGIPGYSQVYGGQIPAKIWQSFMSEAMEGKPVERFKGPTDTVAAPPPRSSEEPEEPTSTPSSSPSPSEEPEPTPSRPTLPPEPTPSVPEGPRPTVSPGPAARDD
ncbi:MAG: carboxypeptidase [Streptosporangiales bacterium]|nr:carboxypeptidase [Streptosporangiales bacterium]